MQRIKEIEVAEKKDTWNQIQLKTVFANYGIVFAFFLIIIILSFLSSNFLTFDNIMNVLRQVSINAIIAVGATYVILMGGIDLSVGSIVALSGVVTASMATNEASGILIPVLMGISVGLFVGMVNGIIIAKWNVAPFIATLAMMATVRGASYIYSDGRPISNLNDDFLNIAKSNLFGIPMLVVITAIVSITLLLRFNKT